MNYGYEGRAVLPVPISIPAGAKPGAPAHLSAKVDYLICAEVCVPGEAIAQLGSSWWRAARRPRTPTATP